ncbi:hypothetical protein [Novisyntrophococcus fermenticellae]|uniref:hypothetical protein n=1 Tax=Novisyntrophococcus fermenticellae TaxID=2068655 RepID=UPI001E59138B|nr:hypothetical protein [Novisyntrophococcus fermenticellae]
MNGKLARAYEWERNLILKLEFEKDLEEAKSPAHKEAPERKKLKRELNREALARLESAARTEDDFNVVVDWWDRLDSNRERKERYHEVGRNAVPLEWGASADTVVIPNPIQHVFWKQILKGEFLDAIFDCPLEMHELVEDADISASIKKLKDEHKEILYYLAIRQYSNQRVACIREQSDRNIRKVRDTVIRKLRKSLLATLQERIKNKIPLTNIERDFLSEYGNNDGCTD